MKLISIAAALALLGPVAHLCADLPSESQVPGELRPAADLPPESQLPSYVAQFAGQSRLADEAGPASSPAASNEAESSPAQGAAPPPAAQQLPDERQLPADAGRQPDPNQPIGDALPIKGSPDGIPWLRLNRPGHTAPLRALAFSDDGRRLTTAGDDKTLVVWGQTTTPAGAARWSYERTVRWQIQRGARGRIYALAAAPQRVALAGEGAMGGAGEILLIDPASGDLAAVLNDLQQGHRQVVVALSFAESEPASLASLSIDGSVVHWSQAAGGLWNAKRLAGPDRQQFGNDPALVERLLAARSLSAVAALDGAVVAPAYATTQNNRIVWRLQRYAADGGRSAPLAADDQSAPHLDYVTALAVGAGGRRLASADGAGNVYLWDLAASPVRVLRLPQTGAQVLSLAFDAPGDALILGCAVAPGGNRAPVEIWDVADAAAPRRRATFAADKPVMACGLAPDGSAAAWTSGADVVVRSMASGNEQRLAAGASPPLKVAFPTKAPFYRLGFGKKPAGGGKVAIDHVFDADLLRLDRLNRDEPARWLPEDWLSGGWQVRQEKDAQGTPSLWFYEGATRRGRIPLVEVRDGAYRTVCWIPSRQRGAGPAAAAIGTSAGEIHVYRLADDATAPLVRRLRGHWAEIASLAVSADLRYLASASLDGTLAVWPLSGLLTDSDLVQRWGADFRRVDGALEAADVRRNGPAYFRGLRNGDRITELRYRVADEDRVIKAPEEMLAALRQADWRTLMTFHYVRGRTPAQAFQILPAWQQVVSLLAADDGQWAYWTPAGYYDASFEGHKLFGWQINRGLEMLPDFFLAAQFRRQLERPGAMSRLLRAGDLEAAFQAALLESPTNSPDALVNAYRLKPDVQIVSPRDGDAVGGEIKLRAVVSTNPAERLAAAKAFANGVAAVGQRLVSEALVDGERQYTYEWDLRLPSDRRVLLQVSASTRNEVAGGDQVVVSRQAPVRPPQPRLFLVSVGVDSYRDAQIPRLSTAVKATEDLLAVLEDRAAPLYRLDSAALLEDRATRPSWRALTSDVAARLAQQPSPDDVLVIFLSGHGLQAPGDAGYQFVTADARYADVVAERYGDCLSMSDLADFADIPCRKVVVLNTCHGGSAQPLLHRELKSAVRALQDDLVLTLAASGGEEEAVEGRFANRLLEALGGAADEDRDGVVSFAETFAYVQRTVAADSSRDAVRQTPTAGPAELLPYAAVPLTAVGETTAWRQP